jgi:hypothetical protein
MNDNPMPQTTLKAKVIVKLDSCIYCGSKKLVKHVKVNQTAEVNRIGLAYQTSFIVTGTEPLYADICDDCGSLLRTFVDTPGKPWMTK